MSNIPPGNATGTALSGTYLITSSTIDSCDCRVGNCSTLQGESGETVTVIQMGGSLSFTLSNGQQSTGGVNADNSISVGGVGPIPGEDGTGQVYVLRNGTFDVSSGGLGTGIQVQAYWTLVGMVLATSYDCDLVLSDTLQSENAVTTGPTATSHQLPGAWGFNVIAGDCLSVNSVPQLLPASTVSFTVADINSDILDVSVVVSSNLCQAGSSATTPISKMFTGSTTYAATVPAGTYDLSIGCKNASAECNLSGVTWEAIY